MSTPPSAQPHPQNKSRKKRPADVVSFEDLLAAHKTERAPGQLPQEGVVLIGVDLELQRRMAERISLLPPSAVPADQGAPNLAAPVLDNNNSSVITIGALNLGAPIVGALIKGHQPPSEPASTNQPPVYLPPTLQSEQITSAPNIGAPFFSAPKNEPSFDLRDLLLRRTKTKSYVVHTVSRIEDVFTSAERDLLKCFWERGRPVPNTQRIRLVTGPNGEGARRLALQVGLIYNTFKNLTHALSTKFALEIVKPDRNLPTVYAIYHYSSILERQRSAGFTGVVHKNGGGRELVNAIAQPAQRRPDLTLEELAQIIGAQKSGAHKSSLSAPNFEALSANFGAPKIAALIRNNKYTSEKEYTTSSTPAPNISAPTIVGAALFQRTGRTDTDATRLIIEGCQQANASIRPDEIARLIRTTQIPANITNPVGLLIRALPGRCAPESISNYREQWQREDEQEKRHQQQERAQTIETARSLLESFAKGEQWDKSTIDWAKSVIADAETPGVAN